MATIRYFEEKIIDKCGEHGSASLEFGTTTSIPSDISMYLVIDGREMIIIERNIAEKICRAFENMSAALDL